MPPVAKLKAAKAVRGKARNARLLQTTVSGPATDDRTRPPLDLPGDRFGGPRGFKRSYQADPFGRLSRSFEDVCRTAIDELAALSGLPPARSPEAAARCGSAPDPHRPLPVGDVAGLLARRPDVSGTERRLAPPAAATAALR